MNMRPDRDEAEYLELASRYTSSIALPAPGGEAVLIAPRWLLTAAHRARPLQQAKANAIEVAGRSNAIVAIHVHPQWRGGGDNDIALLRLREPVRGIAPTAVHRGADEAGRTVVVVAHGTDRRARAAINTIERLSPTAFGLRIKPLAEASDLQGALTAAQTGAGAYLDTPQGIFVAGIHQAAEGAQWNLFTRASAFVGWIESVLLTAARDDAEAFLGEGSR
jgi:hypothetical protein